MERTPVRLDLSHSAWSDIFFLGMDYPEGARGLEHFRSISASTVETKRLARRSRRGSA